MNYDVSLLDIYMLDTYFIRWGYEDLLCNSSRYVVLMGTKENKTTPYRCHSPLFTKAPLELTRMSIAFWRTNNRSYLDESSNKDVMSVGNILNERENNYYIWLSNDLRVMKTALVCEHNVREIYSDLDTNGYGKSWTSPGTRLVKNHESQPTTNESQVKTQRVRHES